MDKVTYKRKRAELADELMNAECAVHEVRLELEKAQRLGYSTLQLATELQQFKNLFEKLLKELIELDIQSSF